MRTLSLTVVFLLICGVTLSALPKSNVPTQPNSGQEAKAKREQFAANAFLPRGAGRRMVGAGSLAPVDFTLTSIRRMRR
jgi:hypothetical protein